MQFSGSKVKVPWVGTEIKRIEFHCDSWEARADFLPEARIWKAYSKIQFLVIFTNSNSDGVYATNEHVAYHWERLGLGEFQPFRREHNSSVVLFGGRDQTATIVLNVSVKDDEFRTLINEFRSYVTTPFPKYFSGSLSRHFSLDSEIQFYDAPEKFIDAFVNDGLWGYTNDFPSISFHYGQSENESDA